MESSGEHSPQQEQGDAKFQEKFQDAFSGLAAIIEDPSKVVFEERHLNGFNFKVLDPSIFNGTTFGFVNYLHDNKRSLNEISIGQTRPFKGGRKADTVSDFDLYGNYFGQTQFDGDLTRFISVDVKNGETTIGNEFKIPEDKKRWFKKTDKFPAEQISAIGIYGVDGKLTKLNITFLIDGISRSDSPSVRYIKEIEGWRRHSVVNSIYSRSGVSLITTLTGEKGVGELKEWGITVPDADTITVDSSGVGKTLFQ